METAGEKEVELKAYSNRSYPTWSREERQGNESVSGEKGEWIGA